MSEVNNKNRYLDLAGLSKYDGLIKALIAKGNSDLANAIAALNAKIGTLEVEGSDDKTLSEYITNIYASIADIVDSQEDIRTSFETADKDLSDRIQKIVDDLEFITGSNSDNEATLGEINLAIRELSSELEGIKASLNEVSGVAGEAKSAAEQAKSDAATAGADAAQAKSDAAGAVAAATGAVADAAQAKTDAAGAVTAAGEAQTAAAGAVADATQAKTDAAGAVADAAQAKTDAAAAQSAVSGLGVRIGELEGIAHASDVRYEDGYINLYDANDNKIGEGFDASPFIIDGMLDSVDFVKDENGGNTSVLRFTFNIDTDASDSDDNKKTIDVDFAKYVDVYHADETSLALDSTTNTFSIKEVAANKTKLNSDITIAGGPLANNIAETGDEWPWTDAAGNKIIPQGKSMEEILTGLFLKVVDGTVEWGSASWSPTIANPTVTLSSNGPVEVGSTVTISTLTAGAVDAKKRSVTCTCTQGHFLADAEGNPTGSHVPGNKTIEVSATIDGDASLSCTWNGVACDASDSLVVVEGSNKVIANQSGQTAKCDALPTTKVFGSTNTKSVLSNVSDTFSEDKPDDIALSSSGSDTINAYYPIYTNGVKGSNGTASTETALVANDGTKLSLVADNTAFYVNFAPMIDGGTGYRLVVKSGKVITEAMALNTLNSKYEVDMKSSFVKATDSVKMKSGGKEIDYDVYEAKGSAGANALRFKID